MRERLDQQTLFTAISYILFSSFINKYISLIGITFLGFLAVLLLIDLKSKIQILTPKNMMAKGLAFQSILLKIVQPFGMLVGSFWVMIAKPITLFWFMSGMLVFVSVVYAVGTIKADKRINFRRKEAPRMIEFEITYEETTKRVFSGVDMDMPD